MALHAVIPFCQILRVELGVFSLTAFAFTFLLIASMEMGDKTQFVVMALATKTRRLGRVAAGATIGISAVIILGVALGTIVDIFVPVGIIDLVGAAIFVLLGLVLLVQAIRHAEETNQRIKEEEKEVKGKGRGVLAGSALAIGLMEFGDKTQVATITLAATYDSPLSVALGAILAQAVLIVLEAYVGARLFTRLRRDLVDYLSSVLFIIAGIAMIIL